MKYLQRKALILSQEICHVGQQDAPGHTAGGSLHKAEQVCSDAEDRTHLFAVDPLGVCPMFLLGCLLFLEPEMHKRDMDCIHFCCMGMSVASSVPGLLLPHPQKWLGGPPPPPSRAPGKPFATAPIGSEHKDTAVKPTFDFCLAYWTPSHVAARAT